MNILLDSWSTQVMYQQAPSQLPDGVKQPPITATGMRLNTLLGMMASMGQAKSKPHPTPADPWNVTYSTYPITAEQLDGIDVYVTFTRYPDPAFQYQPEELTALQNFVAGGCGILLLTNHGPFPNQTVAWSANDMALAAQFGITLEPYAVGDNNFMQMPLVNAPVNLGYEVNEIVAHDSCIILPPDNGTTLAEFPDGVREWYYNNPDDPSIGKYIAPVSLCFSCLVPFGAGNVIVVGNSGMFADYGSPSPSCGLIPMGSNLLFFINCLSYLNNPGMVQPVPGYCQ